MKHKKYWLIGAGIFLGYAIIMHIAILISVGTLSSNLYYYPVYPVLKLFKIVVTPFVSGMTNVWLIGMVVHIDVAISYIVEGAVLGWLYGKIMKKDCVES